MDEKVIYLDNHSATRPSVDAMDQMLSFYKFYWQTLSSPYFKDKKPFDLVNQKIQSIKRYFRADDKALFLFASSGSEALNKLFCAIFRDENKEIVTTKIEEMPLIRTAGLFKHGKEIPVDHTGQVITKRLARILSSKTELISLSWANGLTGVIQPIEEIASLCQKKGIKLHVDVSNVIGKIDLSASHIPIDYLTFDGRRFHAPQGTGGLIIYHPEHMQFHEAQNLAGIIGLGFAIDELDEHFDHLCLETARLRDRLEEDVAAKIPQAKVLFQEIERLPNCSVIAFPDIASELLAFYLAQEGVYATFGGGDFQELEEILIHCGIEKVYAESALSFSLSRETKEEEIEQAVSIITDCVERISKMEMSR